MRADLQDPREVREAMKDVDMFMEGLLWILEMYLSGTPPSHSWRYVLFGGTFGILSYGGWILHCTRKYI